MHNRPWIVAADAIKEVEQVAAKKLDLSPFSIFSSNNSVLSTKQKRALIIAEKRTKSPAP